MPVLVKLWSNYTD